MAPYEIGGILKCYILDYGSLQYRAVIGQCAWALIDMKTKLWLASSKQTEKVSLLPKIKIKIKTVLKIYIQNYKQSTKRIKH